MYSSASALPTVRVLRDVLNDDDSPNPLFLLVFLLLVVLLVVLLVDIHRYYDITEAQQAFDDLSSGNVNLRGVIAMNELASLATQAKM